MGKICEFDFTEIKSIIFAEYLKKLIHKLIENVKFFVELDAKFHRDSF